MRYHDERLRWLQENFSYIDSVTMIDATGKITVKERYNPRYSDAENAADNEWCLNRNLLEVFPSLSHSDSTLLQALQKGELLYRENQCTINHSGKKSVTNNVTRLRRNDSSLGAGKRQPNWVSNGLIESLSTWRRRRWTTKWRCWVGNDSRIREISPPDDGPISIMAMRGGVWTMKPAGKAAKGSDNSMRTTSVPACWVLVMA